MLSTEFLPPERLYINCCVFVLIGNLSPTSYLIRLKKTVVKQQSGYMKILRF